MLEKGFINKPILLFMRNGKLVGTLRDLEEKYGDIYKAFSALGSYNLFYTFLLIQNGYTSNELMKNRHELGLRSQSPISDRLQRLVGAGLLDKEKRGVYKISSLGQFIVVLLEEHGEELYRMFKEVHISREYETIKKLKHLRIRVESEF